jgi:predicted negative regulator of RcsB-dependent stress response
MITRNRLFLLIGALAVLAAVLGYQYYQERQKTSRIEIQVGEGGITIEKK